MTKRLPLCAKCRTRHSVGAHRLTSQRPYPFAFNLRQHVNMPPAVTTTTVGPVFTVAVFSSC